jgi:serine/threonine protein kinase/formylglycine-generating enzyme required for sulfatase activity
MTEPWNEKRVFLEASELSGPAREEYLQRACPEPAQRMRIEALLRHHDELVTDGEGAELLPAMIGEFSIIGKIGEGGMGVVYLAWEDDLDRAVAIKVIASQLAGSEEAVARLRNEAKAAAALDHPSIVRVYRYGEDKGRHYIAMEFIKGQTLAERIRERWSASADAPVDGDAFVREVATWISQVADALDHAHRRSTPIVHCDVKPSNIIIDAQGLAHLTDFGIARMLDPEGPTMHGGLSGSVYYMSPEQALSTARVDHRSDIFSLGSVLYEALAGRRPFDGDSIERVLFAIRADDPPKLRGVNPSIHVDLETICHKATEKEPERRYQTAAHMAADLRCYLEGRPILATPPSLARRARHQLRRHARLIALSSIAMLAVLVLIAASIIKANRDASLGWLAVRAASPSMVYLRAHDDARHVAPARRLGRVPIERLSLEPGQYRVIVVRERDEASVEFNLWLKPGREMAMDVEALDTTQYTFRSVRSLLGAFHVHPEEDDSMVLVEGGLYEFATRPVDDPALRPPVTLEPFLIDKREVSNREYKAFVDATGHRAPILWRAFPDFDAIADLPVMWVSYDDAEAYARWRGKRLPTLFEWHAAVRGREARLYPLASGETTPSEPEVPQFRASLADIAESYAAHVWPVTEPAPWDDPAGLLHTYSNVREMTGTLTSSGGGVFMAGRGWAKPPRLEDLSSVWTATTAERDPMAGFRCARSVVRPGKDKP